MGYTHNWQVKDRHSAQIPQIAQDAEMLALACEMPLVHSYLQPERPPLFSPSAISFNQRDDGCEDFTYPPPWTNNAQVGLPAGLDYCKTAAQPYDVLVAAVLLAIKHHLGNDVITGSEGDPHSAAWQRAFALYRRTFPDRPIPRLDSWPEHADLKITPENPAFTRGDGNDDIPKRPLLPP